MRLVLSKKSPVTAEIQQFPLKSCKIHKISCFSCFFWYFFSFLFFFRVIQLIFLYIMFKNLKMCWKFNNFPKIVDFHIFLNFLIIFSGFIYKSARNRINKCNFPQKIIKNPEKCPFLPVIRHFFTFFVKINFLQFPFIFPYFSIEFAVNKTRIILELAENPKNFAISVQNLIFLNFCQTVMWKTLKIDIPFIFQWKSSEKRKNHNFILEYKWEAHT